MTSTNEGSLAPFRPAPEQEGVDLYFPPIPEHRLPEHLTTEDLIPLLERTAGYVQMDETYERALEKGAAYAVGAAPMIVRGAVTSSLLMLDTLAPLTSGESWRSTIQDIADSATAQGYHFASEHNL